MKKINLEEIIKLYSLNDTITTRQSFIYFGKQLLELAAENARMYDINADCHILDEYKQAPDIYDIDKQSILNTIRQVE